MDGELSAVTATEAIEATWGEHWLLDVREQWEWDAGHAPTARLLPMSAIEHRLDEIPTDRRVLVVCQSGKRSGRVVATLSRAGYDVSNVSGGMLAWQAAGGEIVVAGPDAGQS